MGIAHDKAQAVVDYTLENHGGTFNEDGSLFKGNGFALSINPEFERLVSVGDLTPTAVTVYFHDFAQPGKLVGTWISDGRVIFDVVTIVDHIDEAIELALENNQDAIYDLYLNRTIYV